MKNRKITVLLDAEAFARFEAYCEKKGFKKSTLIARLIREHLDSEGFKTRRSSSSGSRSSRKGRR